MTEKRMVNTVEMSLSNRMKEIICVLFVHNWNEYGRTTSDSGRVLEEYSKCDTCGLENHDRSGYLYEYNEKYAGITRNPTTTP